MCKVFEPGVMGTQVTAAGCRQGFYCTYITAPIMFDQISSITCSRQSQVELGPERENFLILDRLAEARVEAESSAVGRLYQAGSGEKHFRTRGRS